MSQLYLSGRVLIFDKFFIKIIIENKITKTANSEAKFKLKLSVTIIGLSVKISKHGLAINKRNKPSFGFNIAAVKIKNKTKRNNLKITSRLSKTKKEIRDRPISKNMIRFL